MASSPWAKIEGADRISINLSVIQADGLAGDPSKIDAFCRVWVGRRKMRKDTQIYQNSGSPAWNEVSIIFSS